MEGDKGNGTPKDFNECVSHDQLREAIENGQKVMTETITQAVTAAIRDLNARLSADDRVEVCQLAIADGVTICRRLV